MENHMTNISLINSSLEIIYRSTTLSNHSIIRLIRFVSRFELRIMEWFLSLIHI
jgi:hypothetical protein